MLQSRRRARTREIDTCAAFRSLVYATKERGIQTRSFEAAEKPCFLVCAVGLVGYGCCCSPGTSSLSLTEAARGLGKFHAV